MKKYSVVLLAALTFCSSIHADHGITITRLDHEVEQLRCSRKKRRRRKAARIFAFIADSCMHVAGLAALGGGHQGAALGAFGNLFSLASTLVAQSAAPTSSEQELQAQELEEKIADLALTMAQMRNGVPLPPHTRSLNAHLSDDPLEKMMTIGIDFLGCALHDAAILEDEEHRDEKIE